MLTVMGDLTLFTDMTYENSVEKSLLSGYLKLLL